MKEQAKILTPEAAQFYNLCSWYLMIPYDDQFSNENEVVLRTLNRSHATEKFEFASLVQKVVREKSSPFLANFAYYLAIHEYPKGSCDGRSLRWFVKDVGGVDLEVADSGIFGDHPLAVEQEIYGTYTTNRLLTLKAAGVVRDFPYLEWGNNLLWRQTRKTVKDVFITGVSGIVSLWDIKW